jgi:hypothetical protein
MFPRARLLTTMYSRDNMVSSRLTSSMKDDEAGFQVLAGLDEQVRRPAQPQVFLNPAASKSRCLIEIIILESCSI